VNGDGLGDLLTYGSGAVEVLSGADASVLWSHAPDSLAGDTGRSLAAPGDLDGDGVSEVAFTGALQLSGAWVSYVHVWSVPNDREILTLAGGDPAFQVTAWCASAGDFDADGFPDLVGDFSGQPPRLASGATGAILATLDPTPSQPRGVGDIDADGFADVAGLDPTGLVIGSTWLRVLAGPDAQVIVQLFGSGNAWGSAFAGVGDLDGDGHGDLVIGAPETSLPGGGHGCVMASAHAPAVLASLQPTSGLLGAAATGQIVVTITGSHFDATTHVLAGGAEAGFQIVSASELKVTLPELPGLGPVDIVVLTDDGPSQPVVFTALVTEPPILDAPIFLHAQQPADFEFWGGVHDGAFLLVSPKPDTFVVQGWSVLRDLVLLAAVALDDNGAGAYSFGVPSGHAGAKAWWQVVTLEHGHVVGASEVGSGLVLD
jgi:hypothetical protein